jgi:Ca-activated chloride channel family protein
MKFFAPYNLLWLLLLVPVIVFFYLLRLKRRELVVSSVLLWNHLVKDVQANAPFQKLRKNLLLLLQLLIALFAILALARPAFFSQSLGGANVVIILDGSASMQTRDADGGSRFDAARAQALKMVGSMHGGDSMMVLLATAHTHRLSAFTSDQNELRRVLNSAKPADTTTNLRDALLLAVSVAGSSFQRRGSHIYVLSDGAFAEMDELDTRGCEVSFVKLGTHSNNVGIVALDVRREFNNTNNYQMFVAVRNFSPEPVKGNLEFYRNDALIDVRPLEIAAADKALGYRERAEVFNDLPATSGILRTRLDIKDDLETDNEAYSQLSVRQEINVLLVSDGNLYLEKALNLDPHVKLSKTTPSAYNGQTGYDVVVFENEGPKQVGPGNFLYINCGGPTAPVEIKGKVTDASILNWERLHPVMRYVSLNQLNLQEALSATKRPWGVILAEHESGPAIVVGEKSGVKSAFVGFPLLRSQFPLRVAFPIFFNNLVQWLAARPGKTEGQQLRTGEPMPIDAPPAVTEVTVLGPDGSKEKVQREGPTLFYQDTERRGIYRVEGKNLKREFAVNLLSRDESAVQPQEKIQFGRRPVVAGFGAERTARETWRWLVLLAAVILAVEWWVYHKRI